VKNDGGGGDQYSPPGGAGSFAGTQDVYFDFDTFTGGGEHVYTAAQRDEIVAAVAAIYTPWDFTFSHTVVPGGAHAKLNFNTGPAGGLASDIDFRNLDLGGSASINVCGILGGCPAPLASIMGLSKTIAAHELGHLVGLRHADSLGPIGNGLSATGPNPNFYFPAYTGGNTAGETTIHTMASPASVGQTLAQAIGGTVMGERSAVKMEFTEVGTVTPEVGVAHNNAATAQALTLPTIAVPNTALLGHQNHGMYLNADVEVVTGSIGAAGQLDYYSFSGTAGDRMNAEGISLVPLRYGAGAGPNNVDTTLTLIMPDGVTPVPGQPSFNDDEFESFDSALIDVLLPVTGTYYVRVGVTQFLPNDTGKYELYLYRFRTSAVPEPTTLVLVALGGLAALGSIRRRARS
jgi:hypothetical protein